MEIGRKSSHVVSGEKWEAETQKKDKGNHHANGEPASISKRCHQSNTRRKEPNTPVQQQSILAFEKREISLFILDKAAELEST